MEMNHYEKQRSDFYSTFSKCSKIEHQLVTIPLLNVLESNVTNFLGSCGLDYGCGNGFVTEIIHGKGANIIGVDNSIDQLRKAKEREGAGIKFFHITKNNIGFIKNDSLDFCVFRFSICEMNDTILNLVFNNVAQKLKKGGIVAIGDQNREKCVGHETMDVYYPNKSNLQEGEATTTILKRHGIRFSGNENMLVENLDFIPIIDHFRSKSYMKYLLEKKGFSGVTFQEMKLDKDYPMECFDEKTVAMYKITTARK